LRADNGKLSQLLEANAATYHAAQRAHTANLEVLAATRRELDYWRSARQSALETSSLLQIELDRIRPKDYADRMAAELAALSAEERQALLHGGVLRADATPIDTHRDKPTPRWAACTMRSKLSRERWGLAPIEPGFSPLFYACRLRSPDGRCRYCGTQLINLQLNDSGEPSNKHGEK